VCGNCVTTFFIFKEHIIQWLQGSARKELKNKYNIIKRQISWII
jgi:hypothetical protein